MNIIKSIGVIGDSILKGVIFDEIVGKYRFLQDTAATLFAKTNKVDVKNYSRFGFTTNHALQKLPTILDGDKDTNIVLLELGGNDCDYRWDEVCANPDADHKPNVPYGTFKQNVKTIIEKILAAGKRPVVMTLPPIDADKYFDWIVADNQQRRENLLAFLGDKNYIYRTQERYANALQEIAAQYNLVTVKARESLLNVRKYSDYICKDGIHLNEQGQSLIKKVFDQTYREHAIIA